VAGRDVANFRGLYVTATEAAKWMLGKERQSFFSCSFTHMFYVLYAVLPRS